MIYWAAVFLVIALGAAFLGFSGIAGLFDEHRLDTICRRLGTGRDLLHRRTSPTGPIAEQAVRILHSLRLVVLPSRGVAFCTRTCRSNERLASTSCSSRVALHTRMNFSRTLGARTVRPHGRLSGLDPAPTRRSSARRATPAVAGVSHGPRARRATCCALACQRLDQQRNSERSRRHHRERDGRRHAVLLQPGVHGPPSREATLNRTNPLPTRQDRPTITINTVSMRTSSCAHARTKPHYRSIRICGRGVNAA
jgi:hypothetical protein